MDINHKGKYLFLGGTRSGKSELAERMLLAMGCRGIRYVATSPRSWMEGDLDFAQRVAAHRSRRPSDWQMVELEQPEHLYEVLEGSDRATLVDSVGAWIASREDFEPDLDRLVNSVRACAGVPLVFVSEEVGMGVHPVTLRGRSFIDSLGDTNSALSDCVDRAFLVIAGRIVDLGSAQFSGGGAC